MLAAHYFEIICCPGCRGDLVQVDDERLRCGGCAAEYPVVEGIPVLLAGSDDEVSRAVSAFYRGAWKKTVESKEVEGGEIVAHDDASDYGRRYVRKTAERFLTVFRGDGPKRRFFLDAACGACPREQFGKHHTYHVCLDFTLEALLGARRLLGERAVCVCGSLLRAPLRDAVFDGILASHCIYHIDKDLQGVALRELLRTLAPGGRLLVFYANPDNARSRILERRLFWPLKALLSSARRWAPPPVTLVTEQGPPLYCHLHSIEHMMRELSSACPDARVWVRPLCLFTYEERAPFFQQKGGLDVLSYGALMGLERLYRRRPEMSYYLAYVVERARQSGRPT